MRRRSTSRVGQIQSTSFFESLTGDNWQRINSLFVLYSITSNRYHPSYRQIPDISQRRKRFWSRECETLFGKTPWNKKKKKNENNKRWKYLRIEDTKHHLLPLQCSFSVCTVIVRQIPLSSSTKATLHYKTVVPWSSSLDCWIRSWSCGLSDSQRVKDASLFGLWGQRRFLWLLSDALWRQRGLHSRVRNFSGFDVVVQVSIHHFVTAVRLVGLTKKKKRYFSYKEYARGRQLWAKLTIQQWFIKHFSNNSCGYKWIALSQLSVLFHL